MTRGRQATLTALVDTFVPGAPADAGGSAYPSASQEGVDRTIEQRVLELPHRERKAFDALLSTLDSPALNLLLSGRAVRFRDLPGPERERLLYSWATSRWGVKRRGFHAMKRLVGGIYFSGPLASGGHPLWERIRYRLPPPTGASADPLAGFSPIRPDTDGEESTDVCVIGSGAGGSLIAAKLARAGYRVTILEAGGWLRPSEYPRVEREAYDRLFFGRALVTTGDGAFGLLAGATVGGSTTINWMTCLPPLPEARAEWARDGGLNVVDRGPFDAALAEVGQRLSVSAAESVRNASNQTLERGCVALGYRQGVDWEVISRNALGCEARCGFCTFGCPYGAKQSVATTYLKDALAAGARLYPDTRAESIELYADGVRGVRAKVQVGTRSVRLQVRSRAVVVAAGALQTPALLLRSGIRHRGVGTGLRLDPTTALAGEFPDPIRTWEGPHQTIRVSRFQGTDPEAHGPWIEVAPAHPGLSAIAVPWTSASDYRRLLERSERVATPIVLVRDVGEGRVTVDSDGRPEFEYQLTPRDRRNLVRGLVETAQILAAAGATRLLSLQVPYAESGDGSRPVTAAELDRFVDDVERRGIRENSVALFSAHPMGSARAGRDPRTSAARPSGEVHGVDGLWIGDGSLLPSAPGANPMMSILGLASLTADHLLERLALRP